jgi:glycosyltransferase involved in cell wall biosynthesis
MKILQIVDTLNLGGAERMSVNICNALSQDNNEVVLCSAWEGGALKDYLDTEVKYYSLRKRSFIDIIAFYRFIKILKNERPQIVHAHSSSIIWAIFSKVFTGKMFKLVFHDHYGKIDIKSGVNQVSLYRALLSILSKNIDYVISVNDKLADWAKVNLRIRMKEKRIIVLNNFPHLGKKDLKHNRQNTEVEFNIICIANFRIQKNHIFLIRSFAKFINDEENLSAKLVLVGSVGDLKYFEEVQSELARLIPPNQFSIFTEVKDVVPFLENSHLGVLSSLSEGLPVALLEYGLLGLPTIATKVGQCQEVLGNGEFGILIDTDNLLDFSNAMREVCYNYKQYSEMGKKFNVHIIKNYGSYNFLDGYYSLLKS